MSEFNTSTESETGQKLTPQEIFEITAARETRLSQLLMLYVGTGLIFMLLPGTFLGVWNLLAISSRHAPTSVSPAWIQATAMPRFLAGSKLHSGHRVLLNSQTTANAKVLSVDCLDIVGPVDLRCRTALAH